MAPSRLAADFLERDGRRIFTISHLPNAADTAKGGILLVPPFFEELNHSRYFYTQLAQRVCAAGYESLYFDYSCTGDSAGEFADAIWEHWIEDLQLAFDTLNARCSLKAIVGVRGAALTLSAWLKKTSQNDFALSLVAPTMNGVEIADAMLKSEILRAAFEGRKISREQFLENIREQGHAQMGGYRVPHKLLDAISRESFLPSRQSLPVRTSIFRIARTAGSNSATSKPQPRDVSERDQSDPLERTIQLEPFWQEGLRPDVHELVFAVCDDLLAS